MKEFTTAIEQAENPEEGLTFVLDGVECHAYQPTDGQIALAMAAFGRHSNDTTRAAGVIDFLVGVLDESSEQYIVDRLMSRTDPLGLEQVEEIIEWMVEEWVGRPTRSPSGSTPSRRNGGPKSRPRTTKQTSSRSVPASSAT